MRRIHETAFIAPGAHVLGEVTLAEDSAIWYNAVLRASDGISISIGKGSNVQDCCVIHGDNGNNVTVGNHVTVGHGAILHGCTVENGCMIGMGSVILDLAVIGEGSIVGAGALVPSGMIVPPHSLVVGTPAKVKRQLTPEAVERTLKNTADYVQKAKNAKASLGL